MAGLSARLASAISLNEIVLNTSRIVGPALGGALLATVGVAACCAVNAASYVIPLFVLLTQRPEPAARASSGTRVGKGRPAVSLRDAVRYAWRHGPIRVSLFLAAASGLLFNMGVSLPVLATRVFHLGGGGYGLMMSAFGNTLVQMTSAPGMRGRVMGLWTMALPGMSPVNSPFAGLVTQDFGARYGFSLSGLALTLVTVTGWRALTGDIPV